MDRSRILLAIIILLGTSAGVSLFADTDPSIPTASPVSVSVAQDAPTVIILSGASNDGGSVSFSTTTSPSHGTLSAITGTDVVYTPEPGFTGADSFQFIVSEGATSSLPATVSITVQTPAPMTGTAHLTVRLGATIATSTDVTFPLSGTATIPASAGDTHDVAASSTLAVLSALDASSSEYTISDLAYFPSFGSFLVNCITVPSATSAPACFQWQYSVNGSTPLTGMDQYALHDGDVVYVYFGAPSRVVLSTTSIALGTSVTATAESYDPATDSYSPLAGVGIGEFAGPNYAPTTVFDSTTTDAVGAALFTPTATGTYSVALSDAFGSFTGSDAVAFSVVEATNSGTGSGGGFSGGTDPYAQTTFSIPNALAYLISQQKPDGSFTNDYVTDWAALALAQYPGPARDKLVSYLRTYTPTFSSVTDYERHAMALAALDINPYDGSPVDTITPILRAFDGTQVGAASLATDDIFALFPLLHGGYTQSHPTIRSIAQSIIASQKSNGSWEGGADVTAAAVQALGPLFTIPGYGRALGGGIGYLTGTQGPDGGWGNPDSTSWVQTMVNSVREGDPSRAPAFVSATGKKPEDALNLAQQPDGGVRAPSDLPETRAWSTAYAIVAASGKSWVSLTKNFAPPVSSGFSGGTDPYATTVATSTATTTPLIATSTAPISTSAEPIATTTEASVATTTSATQPLVAKKPAPKQIAKRQVRPTTKAIAAPAPAPEAAATIQTAAAADAQQSFLGRLMSWLTHLFRW